MKVCIIAEGSYPIVRGGVSEWTHQLITGLPFIDYDVFCLAPTGRERPIYDKPKNLRSITIRPVSQHDARATHGVLPISKYGELCDCLDGTLHGKPIDCVGLAKLMRKYRLTKEWLQSEQYWNHMVGFYDRTRPTTDFSEFFWTTHGIFSTLMDAAELAQKVPRADVYHSLTTGLGGLVASTAAAVNGTPLVISEHGLYLKERSIDLSRQAVTPETRQLATDYFMTLVKTSYENADMLLPICQNYAENEIGLGASPRKIKVVTNGIDVQKFLPPASRNGSTPVIGCFARIVPLKDQMSLIKASKSILESHTAEFIFAGDIQDKEYFQECQDLATELKVSNHLKFLGHIDNVAEWYRKSDIFVLSSTTEGLPLALLEAMSCGLPSVCTAVGGVPDVMAGNDVGYIVPPGDPASLALNISHLLEDGELRKSMGERAAKMVRERYTIESMEQKIIDVYFEAIVMEHLKIPVNK